MLVGTLDAVRRYPVKSLRGEALDRVELAPDGIPGDRVAALVVRTGNARVGKTYRGKENDRLHLFNHAETAQGCARTRGVEVELRGGDRFFDDAPISLLVDRWLDELSGAVGYEVQWERFRPNLFVRASSEFAQTESELIGATMLLGTAVLRARSPIERCVTVTYHPSGDESDPRILRFLAQHRNTWMGVYCDVMQPGTVGVGDALTLQRKEAPLHGASAHTR